MTEWAANCGEMGVSGWEANYGEAVGVNVWEANCGEMWEFTCGRAIAVRW